MHFIIITFNACNIFNEFSELTPLNYLFEMFDQFINGWSFPNKNTKHVIDEYSSRKDEITSCEISDGSRLGKRYAH